MVYAFKHLSKGTLAYLLNNLEPESNLVVLAYPVVSVSIIIPVIDYPLSLSSVYLMLISS